MMETTKIKNYLQGMLSPKRYQHSLGVAETPAPQARHYRADEEKAYLAGLVHDCGKEVEPEDAAGILKERYGITADAMSLKMPRLLHGPLGACMAQSEFDIYDPEVLDAIRYLPQQYYGEQTRDRLIDFAAYFVARGELRLTIAALEFLREAQRSLNKGHPQRGRIVSIVRSMQPEALTAIFLKYKVLRRAGLTAPAL